MISTKRKIIAFLLTLAALITLFLVAVNTGSLKVSISELFSGLFISYDQTVASIFDLRFPRICIALVGGAALAVAGVLLQGAIRNPLADPGIIGITSGASFFAVLITALFPLWYFFTPLFAFIGGAIAFLLVYSLSWKEGLSVLRIILVGVAVSVMFSGLSSALDTATGGSMSGVASLVDGNISMKTWSDFHTLLAYCFVGLFLAFFCMRRCDLLALEDKTVRSLGINIDVTRFLISGIAVLLASATTAVVGSISFLGLLVPHIARILVGSSHKILIPYSMLLGAFCLLLADTIGRTIVSPYEISAAIVMSVIGGPVFIFLLRKSRGTYGK